MTAAFVGNPIKFLCAFGFDDGVTQLLEISERWIDHPRAGAVKASGAFLERLDDLVAVTRLFLEQRQDDELQIIAAELASGAKAMESPSAARHHSTEKSKRTPGRAGSAMPLVPKPPRKSMMHVRSPIWYLKTYRTI